MRAHVRVCACVHMRLNTCARTYVQYVRAGVRACVRVMYQAVTPPSKSATTIMLTSFSGIQARSQQLLPMVHLGLVGLYMHYMHVHADTRACMSTCVYLGACVCAYTCVHVHVGSFQPVMELLLAHVPDKHILVTVRRGEYHTVG